MKISAIALCILVSATAAFAGPSAASLKGAYSVIAHAAYHQSWYAEVPCKNYSGPLYAASGVANEAGDGTFTFDGKGSMTGSATMDGNFDQDLSNATATWGCTADGDP